MKKIKRGIKRVEFLLAVVAAILLIGSLLSQKFFDLSYWLVSLFVLAYVVVKIFDITRSSGTIFEDYASLGIIIVFGIIHFILGEKINSVIITVMVFVLIYSVGLIPWIDNILKSRKVMYFILSYAFFILMIVLLFAGLYSANSLEFTYLGEATELSFEDSLYFSVISYTTVGYGEFSPTGVNKLISSIQAIMGMILNIAFIGYILASKRFRG